MRRALLLVLVVAVAESVACGRSAFFSADGSSATPPLTPTPTLTATPTPSSSCAFSPPAPASLTKWSRRRPVLVETTGQTTTLTNFPLPLRLTPSAFNFGETSPAGADLRVVDSAGALASWEIESWQTSGSGAVVWVSVPTLAPGASPTLFWIYYDNTSGVATAQDPPAVWRNAYGAVWHLAPGRLVDSSTNGNAVATTGDTVEISGYLGQARHFDGTVNAILSVPNSASLNSTGGISISAWFNAATLTTNQPRIVEKGAVGGGDQQYRLYFVGQAPAFTLDPNGTAATDPANLTSGTWHFVSGTWSGNTQSIYVDGQLVKSDAPPADSMNVTNTPFLIGAKVAGDGALGDFFSGVIDEVEVATVARSADWIAAQYRSTLSSGGSVTIGREELCQ